MSAARRRRVVVKIGGSVLDDPASRTRFAMGVAEAAADMLLDVAIVHGGGAQLSRHQERLGLEVERNDRGLRITGPETARAAVQVLGGEVNAALVSALSAASVRSIGLTCADGGLAAARVLDPALGSVGEITVVDASVLVDLAAARFVPVIATVAPNEAPNESEGPGQSFLNVNADAAVAPIARAWGADAVLFLSDVPSVLDGERAVESLDAEGAARLEARGVLQGGMIPKVEAALSAATDLPRALVKIASGSVPDALRAALSSGSGTAFTARSATLAAPPSVVDCTMGTYRRANPLFVSGEGAWLFDSEGRRYLDWISGIGAASLGHGHPRLARALAEQASTLGHISNLYRNAPGEAFASRLCARTAMDAVFFSNSGSEANETALKLARKFHVANGAPERQRFVALHGSFHGRTFGSLSVTSNVAYREPFGAMLDVAFVDPGDLEGLAAELSKEPAALILEPIQGEGGIRELEDEFLRRARELCDETGTVLIHDEVQCGGGRTGRFLAAARTGDAARPDVVTLAKPIGAGVPIGATLARGAMAQVLQPGDHGSTFGGGTLACRAGLTLLDELDGGLQDQIVLRGEAFTAALDGLVGRHGALLERRGRGLIQGVVCPGRSSEIAAALFEAGVLACTAANDVVRFLPPFILTADDLAEGIERFDRLLTDSF